MRGVGSNVRMRFREVQYSVYQGESFAARPHLGPEFSKETNSGQRARQVLTPINLSNWDHFSSMIKPLIDQCLGAQLRLAKADHRAAYRQLPLRPEQRRLSTITLRDPGSGSWKVLLRNTQLLGSTTATPQ